MPMSLQPKNAFRLGVISDTHGYLPQRALQIFAGVDAILHAGDIGSRQVLNCLEAVAPVLAVRGNMDGGLWADDLAEYEQLRVGDRLIHLIHDRLRLRIETSSQNCLAVVNGHTHRAAVEKQNGLLYVNPGSAGAPRWGEPPCVACLHFRGGTVEVEIIPVED
jgi:uncharacterized protein